MSDTPRSEDLRSDTDVPNEIRYDPDLAVHEPAEVPDTPLRPSRRRSPLFFLVPGFLGLLIIVYLLFGLIAEEGKTSGDYLEEIRLRRGGAWQAAFELSRIIPIEDRKRRDERFVPRLVTLFEASRGEDPRVRRYLALSLGEIRDPRAVDALMDALDDADLMTRIYAAWALGAIGEPRAASRLLPLLDNDDPDLRKVAAYALGALEAPGTAGPLKALLNDPVEDVAWNAALALSRRGDPAGLPLLSRMLDRSYLDGVNRPDEAGLPRALTEGQKEEAMIGALRSLARLGDRSRLPLVRSIRDSDPSLRVRQAAFEALETLEGGSTRPER
jgi:HEAT repeat protein